jgi:formate dehydrogenase maturation protein FdhE
MTNKRLLIVRKILSLLDKTVHYVHGATACPVCTYIGGVGDVKVTSTSDDVRYCRCSLCGATFKAVCCEHTKETVKTTKSFDKTEKRVIKKKRTKKNGKSNTT